MQATSASAGISKAAGATSLTDGERGLLEDALSASALGPTGLIRV